MRKVTKGDVSIMVTEENERMYEVYCGNYECPTRIAHKTHWVADSELGDDGEVWLCPDCRRVSHSTRKGQQ